MPSRIHVSLALLGLTTFLNACPSAEPTNMDPQDDDDTTDPTDDDDATNPTDDDDATEPGDDDDATNPPDERADFRNATDEQLALALKTAADAHGWAFIEAAEAEAEGLYGGTGCLGEFVVSPEESVFSSTGCMSSAGITYSGDLTANQDGISEETYELDAFRIGEGGETHELNGWVAVQVSSSSDLSLQTNLRVDGSLWQGATVLSGTWSVQSDLECGSSAASTCRHGASNGWVNGLGRFDIAGRVPFLREFMPAPASGWVTLTGQQVAEFDLSETDVGGCVRYTLDGVSAGEVCLDY